MDELTDNEYVEHEPEHEPVEELRWEQSKQHQPSVSVSDESQSQAEYSKCKLPDEASGFEYMQYRLDQAIASMQNDVQDSKSLISTFHERLSFVEAQTKANRDWLKELTVGIKEIKSNIKTMR